MKNYCELEECVTLKELGMIVYSPFWRNPNNVLLQKWMEVDEEVESVSLGSLIKYFDSVLGTDGSAPTYEEVFEFFEQKYNLYIEIGIDKTLEPKYCYNVYRFIEESLEWECILFWSSLYYTRAEAKKECLKNLIKIVKDAQRKSNRNCRNV